MKRRQTGLGIIAAIMILVVLGGLSAAIVSLSTGQHVSSAQDVLSAQAWQVASAGSRGGIALAMTAGACSVPPTSTWASTDYPAFKVSVVCTAYPLPLPPPPNDAYNDGETTAGTPRRLRVFQIVATACNGAAATCPDAAASAATLYVERQRIAIAYCEWNGAACTGPP